MNMQTSLQQITNQVGKMERDLEMIRMCASWVKDYKGDLKIPHPSAHHDLLAQLIDAIDKSRENG